LQGHGDVDEVGEAGDGDLGAARVAHLDAKHGGSRVRLALRAVRVDLARDDAPLHDLLLGLVLVLLLEVHLEVDPRRGRRRSAWRGGRRRRRRQGFTAPFALVLSSRRDLGSLALGQRAAAALRTAAGAAAGAAAQAFTNAAQAQLPPLPPLPPRRCSERSDGQRELCCGGVAAPREGRCSEGLALRLRRVALAW
jgi:hypothetical protein